MKYTHFAVDFTIDVTLQIFTYLRVIHERKSQHKVSEIDKNLKFFKDRNIQLTNPEQGMLNSAKKVGLDSARKVGLDDTAIFFDCTNEGNN